jgi:1-acyl-sn-glycerol-3-phosphate acyltransferase
MKQALYKILMRWWGFKITGPYDLSLPKAIIAVVPHTSNIDFFLGLLVRGSMAIPAGFVAKDSLFRFPFGWYFRWIGGHPVVRSHSTNYVDNVVATINELDHFHICIAPEGTRKPVERLKTGFYYIAVKANIPIILCAFDWSRREVRFREPFYPTGNFDEDMAVIHTYFADAVGRIPQNSFPPR